MFTPFVPFTVDVKGWVHSNSTLQSLQSLSFFFSWNCTKKTIFEWKKKSAVKGLMYSIKWGQSKKNKTKKQINKTVYTVKMLILQSLDSPVLIGQIQKISYELLNLNFKHTLSKIMQHFIRTLNLLKKQTKKKCTTESKSDTFWRLTRCTTTEDFSTLENLLW